MITLIIYRNLKELTFEGEGHLINIGETNESDKIYMRVHFDKVYEQVLDDFLYNVHQDDRCRVYDNDGRFFNGKYVTRSRIDANPLIIVSKRSHYI